MLELFAKGIFLGFAISAPVGPINILCMRRSVFQGLKIGFSTGFGAAVGDTFYGALAAFGVTWVSDFFIQYKAPLQILSAIVFALMGISILRAKDNDPKSMIPSSKLSVGKAFISTLALTLTNPVTIMAFVAAFAALQLGRNENSHLQSFVLVLGVFMGSAAWWLGLSGVCSYLKRILNSKAMHRINITTAILPLPRQHY
jgi:threonine/homoserine/homoserine lactone efflux protein